LKVTTVVAGRDEIHANVNWCELSHDSNPCGENFQSFYPYHTLCIGMSTSENPENLSRFSRHFGTIVAQRHTPTKGGFFCFPPHWVARSPEGGGGIKTIGDHHMNWPVY